MIYYPPGKWSVNNKWIINGPTADEYDYSSDDPPPILPRGHVTMCTCGCHKTFGEDCPKDFHSDWCELTIKKENS